MSDEFRSQMNGASPYVGDGRVSARIVDVLKTTPLDERLLTKQIAY